MLWPWCKVRTVHVFRPATSPRPNALVTSLINPSTSYLLHQQHPPNPLKAPHPFPRRFFINHAFPHTHPARCSRCIRLRRQRIQVQEPRRQCGKNVEGHTFHLQQSEGGRLLLFPLGRVLLRSDRRQHPEIQGPVRGERREVVLG
jgi:hypothetical protein